MQCWPDIHPFVGFIGSQSVLPPVLLELLEALDDELALLLDELALLLDELALLLDEPAPLLDEPAPDVLDELDVLDEPDVPDEPPELEVDELVPVFPVLPVPLDDEPLPPLVSPPAPPSPSVGTPSKVDPSAQCSKNSEVRPRRRGSASLFTNIDRTARFRKRKKKRLPAGLRAP